MKKTLGMILWLIATARNALVVLIASLIAFYSEKNGSFPFILTGTVRNGMPDISVPPIHTTVQSSNGTLIDMGLSDMVNSILVIKIKLFNVFSLWGIENFKILF